MHAAVLQLERGAQGAHGGVAELLDLQRVGQSHEDGEALDRDRGSLEGAAPREHVQHRHHLLADRAGQVQLRRHVAARMARHRRQPLHRHERLERRRDVHRVHREVEVEGGALGNGRLVETAGHHAAAQHPHPEVVQRDALVLHPQPAPRVLHLELAEQHPSSRGAEGEVHVRRHRDHLRRLLVGAPLVQVEGPAVDRRLAAQLLVAHREAQQVVERAGGAHVAAADARHERRELGAARGETEPRRVDREGVRQRLRAEGEPRDVHRARRGDAVVLARVHPRLPRAHLDVGGHEPGELAHVVQLDGARQVGEIDAPRELELHVGIAHRRPQHQPAVHRPAAHRGVEALHSHHGAVHVAARVVDREVERDVLRREREVGIAKGAVLHLRADRERREDARPVLPLHLAGHGHGARGLHALEVARVDGGDEREDVAEVGAGRGEREVERGRALAERDRTGEVEDQVVHAEPVVGECEALRAHVGRHVGVERHGHSAQVRHPRHAERDAARAHVRAEVQLVAREVAAQGDVERVHHGGQLRVAVVVAHAPVADHELAQREGDRARVGRGGLLAGAHDVPVGRAVLQHHQPGNGALQLHLTHHDRVAAAQVADHAPQVEHHAETLRGEQRVPLEPVHAGDAQPVQPEGGVGEVADQTQPHAVPAHLRVHGARDRLLHARLDAVAEEEGEENEEEEHRAERGGDADGDLSGGAHGGRMGRTAGMAAATCANLLEP